MNAARVDSPIARWVLGARRRIRLRRGLNLAVKGLAAWGVLALLLMVVARVLPLGWERRAVLIAGVLSLIGSFVVGVAGMLPAVLAARSADSDLGGADRIATAFEREGAQDNWLEARQSSETATWLRGRRQAEGAPLRVQPRSAVLALLLGGMVLLLMVFPNPMDSVIAEREAEAVAITRQSQAIDEQIEQIRQAPIDAVEKQKLVEELEKLAEELAGERSIDQALEEIARSEGRLQQLQRSDDLLTKTLSAAINRDLAEKPLASGTEGDLSKQLDQLAKLAPDLADSERADAAGRIEKMAETLAAAAPELSKALAEAAAKLKNAGDPRAAESLKEASMSAAKTQSKIAGQAAVSEARSTLSHAADDLVDAQVRLSQSGQGQGEGQSPGQGQGQGEGQSPGQGQGQGEGQSPGQGAGAGQGPGSVGGREGGSGSSGVGESKIFDPIFGGTIADQLRLSDEADDSGRHSTVGKDIGPQSSGTIQIPYRYVYPAWSARASRNVEVLAIPASLRSFVRDYFAALNPEEAP